VRAALTGKAENIPRPRGPRFSLDEIVPMIGRDRVVWDPTLPGFGLRTFASGKRSWIVFTRVKGILTKISFGSPAVVTETEARAAAQLFILEAKVKRDPLAGKRRAKAAPMFSDFAAAYRRHAVLHWKPSTLEAYDSYMRNHLKPAFGRRFMDQINEGEVLDWFATLSRTRAGAANRTLEILKGIFRKAEEWGHLPPCSSPCSGIKRNTPKVYRRYLTDTELGRLGKTLEALEASDPVRIGAVRMLLYTGCRRKEILSLRWSQVTGSRMTLPDTKTRPRVVDLGAAAQAALQRIPRRNDTPWVFPSPVLPGERLKELLPFWHETVLPHAKIKPLRLHDLRHTFASHAAIRQENTPIIAKMLGHSSIDSTQRYMHLADQSALDAAEVVGHLFGGRLMVG